MKDRNKKLRDRKTLKNFSKKKKLEKESPVIIVDEIAPTNIAGRPFKRNFRIDPNQCVILAIFDPAFGMKLARSYNALGSNDIKKIDKILRRNYRSSNNKPLLKINKEDKMTDKDSGSCCNDKSNDCCNKDQNDTCTNDADTCKKGDDCCKKQNN